MIDPSLENFYQRAKSEDPYFQFMKIEVVDLFPAKTHFKLFIEPDFHTAGYDERRLHGVGISSARLPCRHD